jgi:hypothetical protein
MGTGTGGLTGHEIVTRTLNFATDGEEVPFGQGTAIKLTIDVPCPAGKKVLGGGYGTTEQFPGESPQSAFPLNDTTWRVIFGTFAPAPDRNITAHVVCATAG